MEMFNLHDGLPENLPFEAFASSMPAFGRAVPMVILDRRFTVTSLDDEIAGQDILCAYLAGLEAWAVFEDGRPDMTTPPQASREKGWELKLKKGEGELTLGRPGWQLAQVPFQADSTWWKLADTMPVLVVISDQRLDLEDGGTARGNFTGVGTIPSQGGPR